jgi:hypothetical protein
VKNICEKEEKRNVFEEKKVIDLRLKDLLNESQS